MGQAAYPTHDKLEKFLRSAGVIGDPPTGTDLYAAYASYVQAAIGEWEDQTGWQPFLQDATDVTRYYTPGGPNRHQRRQFAIYGGMNQLELDAGLLSLTSLTTGVTPTSAGTALTVNTDFVLQPANAPARGEPYRWIEFYSQVYGAVNGVVIVGKWGRAATVPDDAYQAVLARAAWYALPELAAGDSGGLQEIRLGTGAIKFGEGGPFSAQAKVWDALFTRTAKRYQFRHVGLND